MFCYSPKNPHFAKIVVRDDEVLTQNGLAFDLDDVDYMRERGIPITPQNNVNDYYDGDPTPKDGHDDFFIPVERVRLSDINDAWNASLDAHTTLTQAKVTTSNFKTMS